MTTRPDVVNVDQLAEMFSLPSWDEIMELNLDYFFETAHDSVKGEEYNSEDERDQALATAEQDAQDDLYKQWHHAVCRTAETLLERALGLSLHACKVKSATAIPYEMRVKPLVSWQDSAAKLVALINGVGTFHYNSLSEFLSVECCTARQAALGHIGYAKRYSDIYGATTAQQYYDRAMR